MAQRPRHFTPVTTIGGILLGAGIAAVLNLMPSGGPWRSFAFAFSIATAVFGLYLIMAPNKGWPTSVRELEANRTGRVVFGALVSLLLVGAVFTWVAASRYKDLTITQLEAGPGPTSEKGGNIWYLYFAEPGIARVLVGAPFYVQVQNDSNAPIHIDGWEAAAYTPMPNGKVSLFKLQDVSRMGQIYFGASCKRLFFQPDNDFQINTENAIPPHSSTQGWLLFTVPPFLKTLDLRKVQITLSWNTGGKSQTASPLDVVSVTNGRRYPVFYNTPHNLCKVPPLRQ